MASEQQILQEIDDALKREQTEKFFKEYGPYLLAGAILAVLFTGLISGYRSWNNKVNAAQTAQLMEAMAAPDQVTALEALAPQLRPGHRALAHMTAAGTLLSDNKPQDALVIFNKAAADKALPAMYKDLATLMSVRLALTGDPAQLKADELLAKLSPLMTKNNPWRWHARIEAALINAHLQNDYATARQNLAEVLSGAEILPPSLTERARALDQVFAQKVSAVKKDTATPDAEG